MNIVKWLVSTWGAAPERKEYDKETECFYIYTSGRMKTARRDAKSSTYYRYFDSEAEALEFIRQRAEKKPTKSESIRSIAVALSCWMHWRALCYSLIQSHQMPWCLTVRIR